MPAVGPNIWAYAVLAVALVAGAVTDVRCGKIRNAVTYPAIAIGLIGHTLLGGLAGHDDRLGLGGAMIGLAVGFGPMFLVWLAGGIGGGDVKLMAAVGALTGWRFTLAAMFYGFLVAAIMAIGVMVKRRIVRRTLARIGRFLYLSLTPSKPVAPIAADSPKIPFGLALCIGSAAALIEVAIRGSQAATLLLRV